jgi:colanic acid/amylovoran biosynthesis glycosyltransferase
MRVLLVCNQFPKASESFIVNKLRGLLDRGWDVHVACNRSEPEQWELYRHVLEPARLAGRVHAGRDALDLVPELRPDLVHFEFAHFARGRAERVQAMGVRTIASLRGNDVNHTGLEAAGYFDEVWACTDALHVLTEDVFRRAVRRGCPPDKAHAVVTPAVDVRFFDPGAREYERRVGTAARPLRILTVGRLHWMKGLPYGIRAIRHLADRGIVCEVRIAGREDYGEARIEIVYAIHDLGLQDTVTLLDAQPQPVVRDLMLWADVLLQPSVSEGFCNAGLEAQAMALPVVTTTSLRENVVDGETGFVVEPRDAEALADRLQTVCGDAALRRSLGGAGRRRACSAFRLDTQIERFDRFYRQVLGLPATSGAAERMKLAAEIDRHERELDALESERLEVAREIRRQDDLALTQRAVASAIPAHAVVAVISRGDSELLALPVGSAVHFPQTADGRYAGHHPASSDEAIAQLEALRLRGAGYLVVPGTAAWWLDHYVEFREHLERRYLRVPIPDSPCAIFDVGEAAAR